MQYYLHSLIIIIHPPTGAQVSLAVDLQSLLNKQVGDQCQLGRCVPSLLAPPPILWFTDWHPGIGNKWHSGLIQIKSLSFAFYEFLNTYKKFWFISAIPYSQGLTSQEGFDLLHCPQHVLYIVWVNKSALQFFYAIRLRFTRMYMCEAATTKKRIGIQMMWEPKEQQLLGTANKILYEFLLPFHTLPSDPAAKEHVEY